MTNSGASDARPRGGGKLNALPAARASAAKYSPAASTFRRRGVTSASAWS